MHGKCKILAKKIYSSLGRNPDGSRNFFFVRLGSSSGLEIYFLLDPDSSLKERGLAASYGRGADDGLGGNFRTSYEKRDYCRRFDENIRRLSRVTNHIDICKSVMTFRHKIILQRKVPSFRQRSLNVSDERYLFQCYTIYKQC